MNKNAKILELLEINHLFYEQDQDSDEKRLVQASKDFDIIIEYMKTYDKKAGPRVGDFVKLDNKYVRFTYDLGETIQTGSPVDSYALRNGCISYSGTLDPALPIDLYEIDPYESTKEGRIWIFSNAWVGAHRGVYLPVPFRVFRIKRDDTTLKKISDIIKNDRLPRLHPLHVCDSDSPLFKATLTEYYFYRNAYRYESPLLKDVQLDRSTL